LAGEGEGEVEGAEGGVYSGYQYGQQ